LLNEFYRSRADFTYDTIFKRYTKVDLLILDDFGLMSSDNYNYRSPTIIITEFGHKKITLFYIYFPLCFC